MDNDQMNKKEKLYTLAVLNHRKEGGFPWEVSWKNGSVEHSNVFETRRQAEVYAMRFSELMQSEAFQKDSALLPYIAVETAEGKLVYLKEFDNHVPEGKEYIDTSMPSQHYFRNGDSIRRADMPSAIYGKVTDEDAIKVGEKMAAFPEDGTPELAAMALADMITVGTIQNDEDLNQLGSQFRHVLPIPLRGRFAQRDYTKLRECRAEHLVDMFKEAFEKDPDLYLDIVHSGRLFHGYRQIFTNDTIDHVDNILDVVLESPEDISCYLDVDAEDIYRHILEGRYDEPEFLGIKEAGSDMEEATRAFMEVADEELIGKLRSRLKDELYKTDLSFLSDTIEQERETADEVLKSEGFLEREEAYLFFGGSINYRGNSEAKLENVASFVDIENALAPDVDYTMVVNAVPGLPYFEAMVHSHDVPTGSRFYILPESKWDIVEGWNEKTGEKGQGYKFLKDAIESNELIRDIFQSRSAVRDMNKAAKTNQAAKLFSDAFHSYFDNYSGEDKADIYNNWRLEDAVYYACERLARVPEVQRNPKPIADVIEKFNPALYQPGEGAKEFMGCIAEARLRTERIAKQRMGNAR